MSRAAALLAISDGQREVLETLTRSRSTAHRVVQRAQVSLLAADGVPNSKISESLSANPSSPHQRLRRATATSDQTSSNRAALAGPFGHDIRLSSVTMPDRNEIGVIPMLRACGTAPAWCAIPAPLHSDH